MVMLELHHKHSETPETPREFLSITNAWPGSCSDEFIVVWNDPTDTDPTIVQTLSVEEWNPRLVFQED